MPALTAERAAPRREGNLYTFPVLAGQRIFGGAMTVITAANFAQRGVTGLNLKSVGVATQTVDNTAGANGALNVTVEKGIFRMGNSAAGDQIVLSDVGNQCFIVDDNTVAKTNGTNTRSVAGIVVDVDAQGVWVQF